MGDKMRRNLIALGCLGCLWVTLLGLLCLSILIWVPVTARVATQGGATLAVVSTMVGLVATVREKVGGKKES